MLAELQSYLFKTVRISIKFVFFLLLIRLFFVEPGLVNGQSMEATFHDNDFFLLQKTEYYVKEPERFDVVQFWHPSQVDLLLVKRVVGMPGETVSIKRNGVYIQRPGEEEFRLEESYLQADVITRVELGMATSIVVPENNYVVLGDNRLFSKDSRDFGPVHRRLINGKVMHFE